MDLIDWRAAFQQLEADFIHESDMEMIAAAQVLEEVSGYS